MSLGFLHLMVQVPTGQPKGKTRHVSEGGASELASVIPAALLPWCTYSLERDLINYPWFMTEMTTINGGFSLPIWLWLRDTIGENGAQSTAEGSCCRNTRLVAPWQRLTLFSQYVEDKILPFLRPLQKDTHLQHCNTSLQSYCKLLPVHSLWHNEPKQSILCFDNKRYSLVQTNEYIKWINSEAI